MVRRVVEFPIEQRLQALMWPEVEVLEISGRPVGSNRQSPWEYHFLYSCDCFNAEFKGWLESLPEDISYRLYGCYAWEVHAYRIVRKFGGFSIYFPKSPPLFDQSWFAAPGTFN